MSGSSGVGNKTGIGVSTGIIGLALINSSYLVVALVWHSTDENKE